MSELTTGGINFGYECPINIIMGQVEQEIKQIQNENENRIMSEIRQRIGVYVDKEELIKALQYDRNQYDKGYSDGRASIVKELEKIKAEIAEKYALNFDFSWSTVCSILDDLDNHIKELKGENNENRRCIF